MDILNEKLGVPDGIYETALDIYYGTTSYLESKGGSIFIIPVSFDVVGNFRINDFEFKSIKIELPITKNTAINGVAFKGAAQYSDIDKTNLDKKVIKRQPFSAGKSKIQISFYASRPNIKCVEILNVFKENKDKIISVITHELKHLFDYEQNNTTLSHKEGEYKAYTTPPINIPPLNDFLKMLYYLSDAENNVKSSELYALIKTKEITKQNFKEFFVNSDVYKYLTKCKNYRLQYLTDALKNGYMPAVNDTVNFFYDDIENLGDSERVELFLEFIYDTIDNAKSGVMFKGNENYVQDVLTMSKEKARYFKRHLNISQQKDAKAYYKAMVEFVNRKADEMLRKLSKLYDLAEGNTIYYPESIVTYSKDVSRMIELFEYKF